MLTWNRTKTFKVGRSSSDVGRSWNRTFQSLFEMDCLPYLGKKFQTKNKEQWSTIKWRIVYQCRHSNWIKNHSTVESICESAQIITYFTHTLAHTRFVYFYKTAFDECDFVYRAIKYYLWHTGLVRYLRVICTRKPKVCANSMRRILLKKKSGENLAISLNC